MATALITGAASLMAEGIALALAERGWDLDLMFTDVNETGARQVANKVARNVRAEIAHLDVRDHGRVDAVVKETAARFGAIHGLVNCAGGLRGLGIERKPLAEIPPQEWRQIIDANLKGVLNSVHAVLGAMKAQGYGSIVSIPANRGLRGGANAAHYSAAKAGIMLFTQTMVLECAECGVRINSIAPGNAEARWKTPGEGAASVPLGRLTFPDDVGTAVAWLLSDNASHVSGACIDVSGGTTLH